MVNNPGGNATPAFCLKYNEVGGRSGEGKKAFSFDDRPDFFFFRKTGSVHTSPFAPPHPHPPFLSYPGL